MVSLTSPKGRPTTEPAGASQALSVAVIGGSISGCITAALLAREGHRVVIHERSTSNLVGRGGGIATSSKVIAELKREGLIDDTFPTIPHSHLRLAKRAVGHEREGRCPWAPELDMQCVLWSGLFGALRRATVDVPYRLGKTLTAVEDVGDVNPVQGRLPGDRIHGDQWHNDQWHSDQIRSRQWHRGKLLRFADGTSEEADLVVCCDGFRSTGRALIFPEAALDYRNLVVWRGVIDEARFEAYRTLDDHPRLSFASMPGSFITYLMPSDAGSVARGERIINWAAYLPVSAADLPATMIDASGRQREGTIPAGQLPPAREAELKALMRRELPSLYADLVEQSDNTAYQPVRVCLPPAQARSRVCLVGDAAVPIQPLTGAGLFKAYENARTLALATRASDLDSALQSWSDAQTELNRRLLATGRVLEQVMIWNTIDLATSDAAAVEHWWRTHVDFPEEYSYLKSA